MKKVNVIFAVFLSSRATTLPPIITTIAPGRTHHKRSKTCMPPAFRCRDTITPKGPSQPATFLFRVTFGAKRKLIHHTVTVTDGTFLFFYFYFVSPISRRQHGGVMRLRILVEKKLRSLSLSPLSSARSTDVQGRKPKRDGINMRAPCA